MEPSAGGPRENSRVVLEANGHVAVHTGCCAVGQGLMTALTQLAADALGLSLERVVVHGASTENLEEGYGTFASRGTIKGGSAVVAGVKDFIQQLVGYGAALTGRTAAELHWDNGAIRLRDGTALLGLEEIAQRAAQAGRAIEGHGRYFGQDMTFSYGAHAAHVAVDPRTESSKRARLLR